MDRLDAMSIFAAVVEAGSFSAASRRLGVPLPSVSRKVAELEAHLNARLLIRTTRKLTLTDAGREVSLGWLVRRLEGDAEVIDCDGGANPCPRIAGCRLRRVLAEAKEAFYRELDKHPLEDLAGSGLLPVVTVPLERITR